MITIDQATAALGIEQSNALHWSLGQLVAAEWDRLNEATYAIAPKTNPTPTVPAGHFKRVYPRDWLLGFVAGVEAERGRQTDLFNPDGEPA